MLMGKKNKLWIWKAYDVASKRIVKYVLGNRDESTCKELIYSMGKGIKTYITDNWEAYNKVIPINKHIIGKRYTTGIEQDNSNTRHYLARFRRRTKVTSRSKEMVDLTLKLYHYINHPNIFKSYQSSFLHTLG